MLHPSTELRFVNSTIGYGIFATEPILKGTIVAFHDPFDIIITPEIYQCISDELKKNVEHFAYINQDGYSILNWDNTKYINHSCDSNILATEYQLSIAVKDIAEGEEITHDYALLEAYLNEEEAISCKCGSFNCRKKVSVLNFDNYFPLFTSRLNEAFKVALNVRQPMLKFMNSKRKNKFIKGLQKPHDCSISMLNFLEKRRNNFSRRWNRIAARKVS